MEPACNDKIQFLREDTSDSKEVKVDEKLSFGLTARPRIICPWETTPPKINSDESLRIIIRAPDNIGNVNKSMAPLIKRDHKNNDIIFNII